MKFYLGPFQGITEAAYRNAFTSHFEGIDIAMCPFITNVHGRKIKSVHSYDLWPENNQKMDTIPQMLSKDPEEMFSIANTCKDLGYKEINWNLGCPFPKVANKQRGSGLLSFPEKIEEILLSLQDNFPIKMSIKCRLGYTNPLEIQKLIPIFNSFKLSEVIIHPRIGKQLYKGTADIQKFKELFPKLTAPVVYNGDIYTAKDWNEKNKLFEGKIDRWMLGRGLLINPFLAEEIHGKYTINPEERKTRLQGFLYDLLSLQLERFSNENNAINRMKELWSYLSKSFENPTEAFRYIRKAKTTAEYRQGENQIFRNCNFVETQK
ncbi:MAG: tRNA dihydrouridine synthase [Bacteroidales bacterium]